MLKDLGKYSSWLSQQQNHNIRNKYSFRLVYSFVSSTFVCPINIRVLSLVLISVPRRTDKKTLTNGEERIIIKKRILSEKKTNIHWLRKEGEVGDRTVKKQANNLDL